MTRSILKKTCLVVLFCVLFLGAVAAAADPALAATKTGNGVYSISTSESDSYTGADITNDGKKDKIETVVTEEKITLKVNGKTMRTWKIKDTNVYPSFQVVVLSKKTAFLEICVEDIGAEKNSCALYQVKKGKLSTVLNYKNLVNNKLLYGNSFVGSGTYYDTMYATKVSGNKIYLHAMLGTKSLGQISMDDLQLKYSKGKFTLLKNAGPIYRAFIYDEQYLDNPAFPDFNMNYFTAAEEIQTVKAAGSSEKGIVVAQNAAFTVEKLAVVKKNIYVQAKTLDGETGWIKLSTSDTPFVTKLGELVWG